MASIGGEDVGHIYCRRSARAPRARREGGLGAADRKHLETEFDENLPAIEVVKELVLNEIDNYPYVIARSDFDSFGLCSYCGYVLPTILLTY